MLRACLSPDYPLGGAFVKGLHHRRRAESRDPLVHPQPGTRFGGAAASSRWWAESVDDEGENTPGSAEVAVLVRRAEYPAPWCAPGYAPGNNQGEPALPDPSGRRRALLDSPSWPTRSANRVGSNTGCRCKAK